MQAGFTAAADRGASWQKMSSHTAQGQYYNEIYCDPKDVDKVYSVETVSQVHRRRRQRPGNRSATTNAMWTTMPCGSIHATHDIL